MKCSGINSTPPFTVKKKISTQPLIITIDFENYTKKMRNLVENKILGSIYQLKNSI